MPAGPENTSPELESSQTEGELTKGQQLGRELEEIAAENNDEGYERQIPEEVEEDEEVEEGTEATEGNTEESKRFAKTREAINKLRQAEWSDEGYEPETEDIEPDEVEDGYSEDEEDEGGEDREGKYD